MNCGAADDSTLLAEGETTHIVTDANMKIAVLPEKYLTVFRAAVGKLDPSRISL